MEGRTRLALGGMATAAASVAVVCAVAMSTSAALADSAAVPAGAAVTVPASATTSPAPKPSASTQAPQIPVIETETVPAPEPEDITSTPTVHTSDADPTASVEQHFVAEAKKTGSWESVQAWAEQRGWSDERIEAWIARLQSNQGGDHGNGDGSDELSFERPSTGDRTEPPTEVGETSGRDLSGLLSGSKREQSRVPPG